MHSEVKTMFLELIAGHRGNHKFSSHSQSGAGRASACSVKSYCYALARAG